MGPPPEQSAPILRQHPQDHSFLLQAILEAQKSVSRLEGEVTSFHDDFRDEVKALREATKGSLGRGEFFGTIGVVITLVLAIGGLYWLAMDARFSELKSGIGQLEKRMEAVERAPMVHPQASQPAPAPAPVQHPMAPAAPQSAPAAAPK